MGIMAKRTRHQTNAMLTHIFSCLLAGCHQVPAGGTIAECASLWFMDVLGIGALFPRPPWVA